MEPFMIFFLNRHFKFHKKNQRENIDVYNDVFYGPAKSQCEIVRIPFYTKMTKYGVLEFYSVHYTDLQICHFYTAQNT
jgi:hypothetical protein